MKVVVIVGTRPEAVKLAPLILALQREPQCSCRVVATAQHRALLDQVFSFFGIQADVDFDIMQPDQKLAELTSRLLLRLDELLAIETPDWVLAQGDTTTVLTAALSCYYRRVRFGHVEAGLRTRNKFSPFPEEMNRVLCSHLADLHFAPSQRAKDNLLAEGIDSDRILLVGNTVVDALLSVAAKPLPRPSNVPPNKRLVLVTAHRRENFGSPLQEICNAIKDLCQKLPDIHVLYPVHPNPNVQQTVSRMLGSHVQVTLCPPLGYFEFVAAMKASTLILSDSGGVQEEAPTLGKPVLVLRDETERPEAVEAGSAKLVGPHRDAIVSQASRLLSDTAAYQRMAEVRNPFGDGKASARIVAALVGRSFEPFTP